MSHSAKTASHEGEKTASSHAETRLAVLDILRGLALLGMILSHYRLMLAEEPTPSADNPTGWLITLFVEAKARAVFAFLFGASFAVMLRRLEAKKLPVVPIFLRRLAVLYVLGALVETLTRFQILRDYAFWGVALLFLRNYPTRSLLVVAAISAAAFSIRDLADSGYSIATQGVAATVAREAAAQNAWQAALSERDHLLSQPEYVAVVRERMGYMWSDLFSAQRWTPGICLSLFILGLLAVRHGIFSESLPHRRRILWICLVGVFCWIAARWLLPLLPADLLTPRIGYRLRTGLGLLDEQFLAFAWIGGMTLLIAMKPQLVSPLSPFSWVGRMALTNYLLHAIVIDFASAAYGLNLRLDVPGGLLFAGTLFALLAWVSRFWLHRFHHGPVEWLWRSLTYGHLQPMRRAAPPHSGTRIE